AEGDLLRCVEGGVESAHRLECFASAEEETAEGDAQLAGKPNFYRHKNPKISRNASAVANGAATANGPRPHCRNCGADGLRAHDGVSVNEDEQITLRRSRPSVSCRRYLPVLNR